MLIFEDNLISACYFQFFYLSVDVLLSFVEQRAYPYIIVFPSCCKRKAEMPKLQFFGLANPEKSGLAFQPKL